MIVRDTVRGIDVDIEIVGSQVFVGDAKGRFRERQKRFSESFWADLVQSFGPEIMAQVEHCRPLTKKEKAQRHFDRYQTYEGSRGNAHQWRRAAEALLGGVAADGEYLTLLGLRAMPATKAELRRAWMAALKREHPDVGGNVTTAQLINQAYERLLVEY